MTLYTIQSGVDTTFSTKLNSMFAAAIKQGGLNIITQLQDRDVDFSADGGYFAEAYVDADGRKNSVDTGSTTAVFATDKYRRGWEITGTAESRNLTGGSASASAITMTFTANKQCILNRMAVYLNGSAAGTVTVAQDGVTLASVTHTNPGGAGTAVATFALSDYSRPIQIGTFTVTFPNSGRNLTKLASQSYSGTIYSYSNQTVPTDATGNEIECTEVQDDAAVAEIYHTIPSGTFDSTISSAFGTFLAEDWESGADVEYKLQETEDTIVSGTASDPDSFTNASNAFDENDSTYASKNIVDGNSASLGKTFSATVVKEVYFKTEHFQTTYIDIETYDGSTWSSVYSDSDGGTGTFEDTVAINSSIEGVRVKFTSGGTGDRYLYTLDIFETTVNEDTGWLNSNELSTFTAFTAEPDTCIVKLIPKTTSPGAGLPAIKGFYVKAE
jgi:hypothetical protein